MTDSDTYTDEMGVPEEPEVVLHPAPPSEFAIHITGFVPADQAQAWEDGIEQFTREFLAELEALLPGDTIRSCGVFGQAGGPRSIFPEA